MFGSQRHIFEENWIGSHVKEALQMIQYAASDIYVHQKTKKIAE